MLAKTSVVLAAGLALTASAQNSTVQNVTYPYNITFASGLAQFLATMNLTSLATAVANSINSTGTLNLLMNVNGTGKTLLAPTNTAFDGFMKLYPNASDTEFTGDILSYHLLSGNFTGSSFAMDPNHTVARTFLNDSAVVQLEGNQSQAMVFSIQGGATRVLNQNTNVTITNTTMYEGLMIQVVDAVIDLPGNLSTAMTEWNLTAANTVFTELNLVSPITMTRGVTLFVPNDAAFAAVNATLMQLAATNVTQITEILQNHVINGTSLYSTELGGASATSDGGQKFTFASNSTGNFVTSGNFTAKIVTADILLDNGVMHIIDTVLANNASNPTAAVSAYSSATSAAAAAATSTQTMGVGASSSGSGSGSSGSGSSGSGSKSSAVALGFTSTHAIQAVAVLAAVFAGAAVLI